MLTWLLSLINPISRILKSIDNNVDNATERERMKNETIQKSIQAQVDVIGKPNWLWVALPFVIPLALYWNAVLFYSILFCANCAYPKPWTVAALPPVFMDWAGWVIGSIFLYKGFDALLTKFNKK